MTVGEIVPWRILVVDDEQDVHDVTRIALRHRTWKRRKFEFVTALSATAAREILSRPGERPFDVALVDAMMETDTAGLDLCEFMRANLPPTLRVVLRTGQAGIAPEEEVLNRYDIDYYLAKAEVTPERLFAVIRACLRSSQDISTLLAYAEFTREIVARQIPDFGNSLRRISSAVDLDVLMSAGLKFLDLKHGIRTVFIPNINDASLVGTGSWELATVASERVMSAIITAYGRQERPLPAFWLGTDIGLDATSVVVPLSVTLEGSGEVRRGGLYLESPNVAPRELVRRLLPDVNLFIDNWKISLNTICLQERVERERLLRDLMYQERLAGIANMVTGVAHEINTPLGVANTANSMMGTLLKRLKAAAPGSPQADKAQADLGEVSELITKNIVRAHRLIESFKKLSAGQLADRRAKVDLGALIVDCVESMRPVTSKKKIVVTTHITSETPGEKLIWDGFGGHLSQVIINFIQNAVRYAYADPDPNVEDAPPNKVDIRILPRIDGARELYRIEVEDYGKGIAAEVLPRLFEPFVTTGRDQGGTGLGLAITHNIVNNLLRGTVECTTAPGKGTKFTVDLPRVVPHEQAKVAVEGHVPLGALLIERGAITPGQLERALQAQRSEGGGRLGEILVRMGIIDNPTLHSALEAQRAGRR